MPNNLKIVLLVAVIAVLVGAFILSACSKKNKDDIAEKENPEAQSGIEEIWKIEDHTSFVIEMYYYISEKCKYGENIDVLNENERVFYVTQVLEGEVNNGGFSQFFFNTDGQFANELVSAFEKIGANQTADICKKAVEIYGERVPLDRDEREALLIDNDEVNETLNDCDSAFYEYEDDLTALNYQFIINNKESFSK